MSADYTTFGHVTVDVRADGSRRAGGTALYSALQAARLGLRARVVTRGVPAEVEALLEPWREELELQVEPAEQTTTLLTHGSGPYRRQRVLAWAGPMRRLEAPRGAIVHLAPVAAELPAEMLPAAAAQSGVFVGLTPQGLVRSWSERRPELSAVAAAPEAIALAARCTALVLSEHERAACAALLDAAARAGVVIAITAGPGATELLAAGGEQRRVAVEAIETPVDDLGAGDVYASAFFVALHEGSAPQRAATFASAAAAARMLGDGPGAIARRETIEARLAAAGRAQP